MRLEERAELAGRELGVEVCGDPEETGVGATKPIGRSEGEGDIVVGGIGGDGAGRRGGRERRGKVGVNGKGARPRARDGASS